MHALILLFWHWVIWQSSTALTSWWSWGSYPLHPKANTQSANVGFGVTSDIRNILVKQSKPRIQKTKTEKSAHPQSEKGSWSCNGSVHRQNCSTYSWKWFEQKLNSGILLVESAVYSSQRRIYPCTSRIQTGCAVVHAVQIQCLSLGQGFQICAKSTSLLQTWLILQCTVWIFFPTYRSPGQNTMKGLVRIPCSYVSSPWREQLQPSTSTWSLLQISKGLKVQQVHLKHSPARGSCSWFRQLREDSSFSYGFPKQTGITAQFTLTRTACNQLQEHFWTGCAPAEHIVLLKEFLNNENKSKKSPSSQTLLTKSTEHCLHHDLL